MRSPTSIRSLRHIPLPFLTSRHHSFAPTVHVHSSFVPFRIFQRSYSHPHCWSCKATCGTIFCPLCRLPQPVKPNMNYYEMLLPEEATSPKSKGIHFWRIPLNKLHQHFIALQRVVHPDVFATQNDKAKVLGQAQSSIINKAYKTLKDDLQRALYLLELYGVPITEESSKDSQASISSDLLLFILETQENLEEATLVDEIKSIQANLDAKLQNVNSRIESLLAELPSPLFQKANPEQLKELKDLIIQMRFYKSLKESVLEKLGSCQA